MLIEKEKLDEMYSNILLDDEEVIWDQITGNSNALLKNLLLLFGILAIIGIGYLIIVKTNIIADFPFLILSGIFGIFISISNVSFNKGAIYTITNKRYIIHKINFRNKIRIFFYMNLSNIKKIYKASHSFRNSDKVNIELRHRLYTGKNNDPYDVPVMKGVLINDDAFNKIEETWFNNTIYTQFNDLLKPLAEKYDLKMIPFHHNRSGTLTLEGQINGMDIFITLRSMHHISNFSLRIKCPNHKKHSLRIFKEGDSTKLRKMLGMQDLQIGNKYLDNKYIFQCDDLDFFNYILDENTQRKLHYKGLENISIKFGDKAKKVKNPKDNTPLTDVLDAHLIDENKNIANIDNYSELSYQYDGFMHYETISLRLVEQVVNSVDPILDLALNIQEYYNEKS